MGGFKQQIAILVRACVEGHRLSQERLYKMFYPDMLRICTRYVKTDELASEALNLAFLKVFQHLHTYDATKGDLGGWIRTIMIRTCIDLNRKECRFTRVDVDVESEAEVSFARPEVLDKLYVGDLLSLIRKLPHATQLVFNLSVIDGYAHKEIAEKLIISEATSRWHLSEAKKQLRGFLLGRSQRKMIGHTEKKEDRP